LNEFAAQMVICWHTPSATTIITLHLLLIKNVPRHSREKKSSLYTLQMKESLTTQAISSILLRSSEIRWISKKNKATFSRNLLQTTYNEAITIDNSQHKIWCSPEGKLLVK